MLASKDIIVPSDDREGREEEACLYGTEYYELEDAITDILVEEATAKQRSCGTADGPDEEAKAACEAIRQRMAMTPSGFVGEQRVKPRKSNSGPLNE
ncbi:MAG: hypothetical protein JXQ75_14985 [Phycisphaerae bacterium]|nr:hypothetical protein [Phycisphaerae bacterium]